MTQISLYIEDTVASKLNTAARSMNCTVSKYVASLISERLADAADAGLPHPATRGVKAKVWMPDDFDAMLEGSVTESLIGALPYSDKALEDYRAERLGKYECVD